MPLLPLNAITRGLATGTHHFTKAGFKSKLNEVVTQLPDDFTISGKDLEGFLANRGVKPTELHHSGVLDIYDPQGEVDKSMLLDNLDYRYDEMATEMGKGSPHSRVAMPDTIGIAAKVTRSTTKGENWHGHAYSNPGEIFWRRVDVPNVPHKPAIDNTYRVQEIQSDVHTSRAKVDPAYDENVSKFERTNTELARLVGQRQDVIPPFNNAIRRTAREVGIDPIDLSDKGEWRTFIKAFVSAESLDDRVALVKQYKDPVLSATSSQTDKTTLSSISAWLDRADHKEMLIKYLDLEDEFSATSNAVSTSKPDLPYEKTYIAKAIEVSIVEAMQLGKNAVTIPIRGDGVGELLRSPGVQSSVYEQRVPSAMKKIAADLNKKGIKAHVEEVFVPSVSEKVNIPINKSQVKDAHELAKFILSRERSGNAYYEIDLLDAAVKAPADQASILRLQEEFMGQLGREVEASDSRLTDLSIYSVEDLADVLYTHSDTYAEMPEHLRYLALRDIPTQKETSGTYYMKLSFETPKDKQVAFDLYSKALPAATATYAAMQSEEAEAANIELQQQIDAAFADPDITPKEVIDFLVTEERYSPAEADNAARSYALMVKEQLTQDGYMSEAEAIDQLVQEGFSPIYFTQEEGTAPTSVKYEPVITPENIEAAKEEGLPDVQELVNKSDAFHFLPSEVPWQAIFSGLTSMVPYVGFEFASEEAQVEALKFTVDMSAKAQETLQRFGVETKFEDGELLAKDPNTGEWGQANSGFFEAMLDGIANAREEIGYGIMGGVIGSRAGGGAGTTIGAGLGTAWGRYEDLYRLSKELKMQEGILDQVYARQMVEAGVLGIGGELTFRGATSLVKLGGKYSWKALKGTMSKVIDLLPKNQAGARQVLLEELHLTEDEAIGMMKNLARLTGTPYKATTEELIANLPQMAPRGQNLVSAANAMDPGVGSAYSRAVADRSNAFNQLLVDADPQMVPVVLREELNSLMNDVQGAYKVIKDTGSFEMSHTPYSFDLKQLGVAPLVEKLATKIQNRAVADQLTNIVEKIAKANHGRKFSDLLDLRQAITEFKYNKKLLKAAGKQQIDAVLKAVDKEIAHASNRYMKDGTTWLQNYKATQLEISKLNRLKDNVIFKTLIRPGVDPSEIVKKSFKHLSAQDGTFEEISAKLTPKLRHAYEKAMLNEVFQKYSLASGNKFAATDWVKFSQALDTKGFRDPQVKELKRIAREFAQVFQNDVSLTAATSGITIPKFQSFLTADPVMRLKYEVASGMFNRIRTLFNRDKAKYMALANLSTEYMKNPAKLKTMNQLRALVKEDPQLASKMEEMHVLWAQLGKEQPQIGKGPLKVQVWGKESTKSTRGPITEGQRYVLDEAQAKKRFGEASVREVSYHRIAKYADIEAILGPGFDISDIRTNKNNVLQKLQDKEFLGINIGDEVVIFPSDSAPGVDRGTYKPRTQKEPEKTYHKIHPELPKGDFTPPSSAKDMTDYINWR